MTNRDISQKPEFLMAAYPGTGAVYTMVVKAKTPTGVTMAAYFPKVTYSCDLQQMDGCTVYGKWFTSVGWMIYSRGMTIQCMVRDYSIRMAVQCMVRDLQQWKAVQCMVSDLEQWDDCTMYGKWFTAVGWLYNVWWVIYSSGMTVQCMVSDLQQMVHLTWMAVQFMWSAVLAQQG